MNKNNKVLELIINFVKAINNGVFCDDTYEIKSPKYLLNQIIRQVSIPENNYYISEKAKQKWEELSKENIKNYSYQKKVYCNNENSIIVKCYKNNGKNFEEKQLIKGKRFIYKDIFHDEHMIPIDVIIKQLCDLEFKNNLNYNSVKNILNNIFVCKMLKEEDRNIKEKYKRPYNLKQIIEKIYMPAGIKIIKLNNI